jgi:hypothetical protein
MKGWLAVANISCSVKARLIFFRSIISFFDRTARADQINQVSYGYATKGKEKGGWRKKK